jgi:catechol 2,3-dioxygenase-like lactoylglutathione lyase family enzyme
MALGGICELVLETEDVPTLTAFYRHLGLELLLEEERRTWLAAGEQCRLGIWPPGEKEHSDRGGDRSAYFFDPAGNRVELWDFFRDGDGSEDGVPALAEGGDGA